MSEHCASRATRQPVRWPAAHGIDFGQQFLPAVALCLRQRIVERAGVATSWGRVRMSCWKSARWIENGARVTTISTAARGNRGWCPQRRRSPRLPCGRAAARPEHVVRRVLRVRIGQSVRPGVQLDVKGRSADGGATTRASTTPSIALEELVRNEPPLLDVSAMSLSCGKPQSAEGDAGVKRIPRACARLPGVCRPSAT